MVRRFKLSRALDHALFKLVMGLLKGCITPLDLREHLIECLPEESRLILDGYRTAPLDDAMGEAMAKATAKEHMMLAVMAGRSSVGDPSAAAVGAQLEEAARLRHRGRPADDPAADVRPGLLERLKAVGAA